MAKQDAKVEVSVAVFQKANQHQMEALANNVFAEGLWENQDEFRVRMDFETVTVQIMNQGRETIFLGIEPDGYTHS